VLGLEGEKFRDAQATADGLRSKASVCSRSIAGIVGSNPIEGTDFRLFSLCVVDIAAVRRSDHWSRGVLPAVRVCLIVCDGLITGLEESYRLCVCI
jgi:hypothetical protein